MKESIHKHRSGLPSPLGFKLPLGWQQDPAWKALLDPVGELSLLAEAGCDYVEYAVGDFGGDVEVRLFKDTAAACADLDMAIALHPYFEPHVNAARFDLGPDCGLALRRVLNCARTASRSE